MQSHVESIPKTESFRPDEDELLDYNGAVAFLKGPSKPTLQDWVSTGRNKIPYLKLGHFVRFRKSSLRAWLKARERNGNSQ